MKETECITFRGWATGHDDFPAGHDGTNINSTMNQPHGWSCSVERRHEVLVVGVVRRISKQVG